MGLNVNTTTVDPNPKDSPQESTDMLLRLAGLVFVGLAIAWLVVTQPWVSEEPEAFEPALTTNSSPVDTAVEPEAVEEGPRGELESTLDNPLRMAKLAFEAGMLLEPESLSAWSLYLKALKADPSDPDAQAGLTEVANSLMGRANVALEQDRLNDAARLVNLVLGELPGHFDAVELAKQVPAELLSGRKGRVADADKPKLETPKAAPIRQPKIDTKPQLAKAEPKRDLMAEAATSFDEALAANRLLTPRDESARHYFQALLAEDAADERTTTAQRALFDRLMNRAAEATADSDEQAAQAWITAAEELDFNAEAIAAARESLEQRMISLATARPIPVSDLTLLDYTPPAYPERALDRDIEGWVDVEFTVTTDGTTTDAAVVNTSHDRYFKDEALAAVSQWQFEPREVRGQRVNQRTFTRLSFKLQ